MNAIDSASAGSTMAPIAATSAMATIALRSDAHAAVLERHRLDFCCGGRRSLAEACTAAGIDVGQVLIELNAAAVARAAAAMPAGYWNERPLPELIDYIVDAHHVYTRAALARLGPLTKKVVARHREHHPELRRLSEAFFELAADLGPHLAREENVLFPYLRALATPDRVPAPPHFCTVRNPVRMMMMQHDRAADLLADLQEATHDFTQPEDACGSYAALYAGLTELRLDLLKHVSLENNVLFPRAIALEDTLLRERERERLAPPDRSTIALEHGCDHDRPVR